MVHHKLGDPIFLINSNKGFIYSGSSQDQVVRYIMGGVINIRLLIPVYIQQINKCSNLLEDIISRDIATEYGKIYWGTQST